MEASELPTLLTPDLPCRQLSRGEGREVLLSRPREKLESRGARFEGDGKAVPPPPFIWWQALGQGGVRGGGVAESSPGP